MSEIIMRIKKRKMVDCMMAFSFYSKNSAALQTSSRINTGIGTLPLPSTLPLVGIPGIPNHSNKMNLLDPQEHICDFQIDLTDEEEDLFNLLRTVTADRGMKSTLRVAGGWVRDKILASHDFQREHRADNGVTQQQQQQQNQRRKQQSAKRAKSKEEDLELTFQAIMKSSTNAYNQPTLSVTEHVDIDITLDDCLGSEFAAELETWLTEHPESKNSPYSVGCILENPEQTKHLETATVRLNHYWIDFVNLRAEEYGCVTTGQESNSRIPSVMRIGTPLEDAQRRDLTINSLFYNINTGKIEDMTGKGLHDLRRGVVDTPLKPLTTLLDDPLRVLRSVRFAARLRFDISPKLWNAASDASVNVALGRKVSRERIGSEVNLMLQSRHPARALELLVNLGLINTVFPKPTATKQQKKQQQLQEEYDDQYYKGVYHEGLSLLSTTHDHLVDCMTNRPKWCEAARALEAGAVHGLGKEEALPLMEDEEARRLLWYAAFLKPLRDRTLQRKRDNHEEEHEIRKKPKKAKERSAILKLLVEDLKRPTKEAQSIESIMQAADEFATLISTGGSESALAILLSGARVVVNKKSALGLRDGEDRSMEKRIACTMDGRPVNPNAENDPVWEHAMEFRQRCAKVLKKVGYLWRAAFILSLSEQLVDWQTHRMIVVEDADHLCDGEAWSHRETPEEVVCGILKKYDVFASAMLQMGLIGIWKQKPILDGGEIKGKASVLPNLPNGPEFRTIMDAQIQWMITHPGGSREALVEHLREEFPSYA